jgi:UDP-2,4-diacetamido-2,4,6-trideoxy-beta-L-altropyranose hydrolase
LITKRTIHFRADGGPTIGMGHFMRSLALAEMLNQRFHCVFATCSPSEFQKSEIEKVCQELLELPNNDNHFELFLEKLNGSEIVVLDNYYFNTEYQIAIRNKGCKLVCIDDLHDKHFVADIVINHAEGIEKTDYSVEPYTQLCLGYKFALLKKEFLEEIIPDEKKEFSCLVMIGGSDPLNITVKLLSLIENYPFKLPVAVVIGPTFQEKELDQFTNTKLYKAVDAATVYKLMRQSKFGILPASTVAIESCAARLPFICGHFVTNQNGIYEGIRKNNLAICIGDYLTIDKIKFHNAIKEISKETVTAKLIDQQKLLLDKHSKQRFIERFTQLDLNLTIRKAWLTDAQLLFHWANDAITRENSFHTEPIIWDQHLAWIEKKLADINCYLFIIYSEDKPAGTVRIERDEETIIGITVAPEFRGKKLGAKLIKMACEQFWLSNDQAIFAYIKIDNNASKKAFENAGFRFNKNLVYNGSDCYLLKAEKNANRQF